MFLWQMMKRVEKNFICIRSSKKLNTLFKRWQRWDELARESMKLQCKYVTIFGLGRRHQQVQSSGEFTPTLGRRTLPRLTQRSLLHPDDNEVWRGRFIFSSPAWRRYPRFGKHHIRSWPRADESGFSRITRRVFSSC